MVPVVEMGLNLWRPKAKEGQYMLEVLSGAVTDNWVAVCAQVRTEAINRCSVGTGKGRNRSGHRRFARTLNVRGCSQFIAEPSLPVNGSERILPMSSLGVGDHLRCRIWNLMVLQPTEWSPSWRTPQ